MLTPSTGRWAMLAPAILLVALLSGCGARGPVTASEAFGFCMTFNDGGDTGDNGGGGCGLKGDYCDAMKEALSRQYTSVEACLAACREVHRRPWPLPEAFGCQATFSNGLAWCRRSCRTTYAAEAQN